MLLSARGSLFYLVSWWGKAPLSALVLWSHMMFPPWQLSRVILPVKLADGRSIKVRFRAYGLFVPTSGLEGKEVVLQGRARKEVTDVAMLRHYAEDAGESEAEIAAITEPETSWNFEADGVLIKK